MFYRHIKNNAVQSAPRRTVPVSPVCTVTGTENRLCAVTE